jgi:hypothetical protein
MFKKHKKSNGIDAVALNSFQAKLAEARQSVRN